MAHWKYGFLFLIPMLKSRQYCFYTKESRMKEREKLGRKVVVTTYRKHGNGAVGGGRRGQSGKRGIIYSVAADGTETELAQREGPTFKKLSKKLFATKFIPPYVAINRSGETIF
jgi:hypothetical protein